MKKRGTILVENIIFIILNLIFLTILILFLFRQGGGAIVLEQSYAKEIAMLIDASKPITTMRINMKEGIELAIENGVDKKDIIQIKDNLVIVKLSETSGYSYSFFNDVSISEFPDDNSKDHHIIKINGYNKNE